MGALRDLTGQKFGRLTVIRQAEKSEKSDDRNSDYWVCECGCENNSTVFVKGYNLVKGLTKSCGCLQKESAIPPDRTTHGMSDTRIYHCWEGMKVRCATKGGQGHKNYSGRGIEVVKEWEEFINFYQWSIENGYSDELTLDRVDVNGDYCPENCRWTTAKVQANNRRNNRFLTINGETKSLAEWAKIAGVTPNTIRTRIERGWKDEEIIGPNRKVKNEANISD